jgi:hypothetical protein
MDRSVLTQMRAAGPKVGGNADFNTEFYRIRAPNVKQMLSRDTNSRICWMRIKGTWLHVDAY